MRENGSSGNSGIGPRLIVLGLLFIFCAPAVLFIPAASLPQNEIGVMWAIGMSLPCGTMLLLLGIHLTYNRKQKVG